MLIFSQGDTMALGSAQPTEEEKKYGARHVEIYKCKTCSAIVRFARYNDPKKLLETRRGRCGEWANVGWLPLGVYSFLMFLSVLQCCAEQWDPELAGFGTVRTMFGPRFIPQSRDGGFISTLRRVLGTSH